MEKHVSTDSSLGVTRWDINLLHTFRFLSGEEREPEEAKSREGDRYRPWVGSSQNVGELRGCSRTQVLSSVKQDNQLIMDKVIFGLTYLSVLYGKIDCFLVTK